MSTSHSINHWPEGERPREKMLARGAAALSDAELLAIFLRTGTRGISAVDLGRQLLQRFGSLHGILNADRQQFSALKGMGAVKYTQLMAVMELARRYLAEQLAETTAFGSPGDVSAYLQATLQGRQREVFLVLFLDSQHRLIASEELFQGTLSAAAVYPREVVVRALRHNAAAVILAHNHPSGVAEPSQADVAITRQIKSALELIDVRVLDHMVVGRGSVTSLAERGEI